jgi:hypothetical protein
MVFAGGEGHRQDGEKLRRAPDRAGAASSDPAMAFGSSCERTGEPNRPVTLIGSSSTLPDETRMHLACAERARITPRTMASAADTQPLDQ